MPRSAYQKRVGAARRTSLALSRKQQRELANLLEQYADDLSKLMQSGRATSSQAATQREVKAILHRLNEELARSTIRSSDLQARTMAQMQAEATAEVIAEAGFDPDAVAAQLGGVGTRATQAVLARDGYASTFATLRRDADRAAEQILATAALRGTDNRSVEKQLRLLVRGSEDIPPELLLDRRLIGKQTLEKYLGIEDPTTTEVAAVRKQAGLVSRRARLIARTEASNAEHEANSIAADESPVVETVKWNRSHRHSKRDSCDVLAEADLYGLGAGVYPTDAIPARPHPRCLCFLTHQLRPVEDWDKPKKPGPELQISLKKVIRREKLSRSEGESLRQAIGIGESRRIAKTPRRGPGVGRTAATVAGRATGVDRAVQSRLVDRALSAIGVDVPVIGRVLTGIAGAGESADAYLSRILKLVEMGAALRISQKLFGVNRAGATAGVSLPTFGVGWHMRHGDREGFGLTKYADPEPYPVAANGNLDKLTDALKVWSARQYNEHLTSIDRQTGRVVYYSEGDMTSITPTVGRRFFNGKRIHHNHPVFAVRYEDPETLALWSFSKRDINTAFTKWTPFEEVVTCGPATFWLKPKPDGPDFRSKLWKDGVSHVRDGRPGKRVWDDIHQKIALENKWPTGTLDEYRPSSPTWPGPDDTRWIVFRDYDAWKEARLAGETRALLDKQYDAWVRDQTWEEWAELYDFDYSVEIDPDFDWSLYHQRPPSSLELRATGDALGLTTGRATSSGFIESWDEAYNAIGGEGTPWGAIGVGVGIDDSWIYDLKRTTGQWWQRVAAPAALSTSLKERFKKLGSDVVAGARVKADDVKLLIDTYREGLGLAPDDIAALTERWSMPIDWAATVQAARLAGIEVPERLEFDTDAFYIAMEDMNEWLTEIRSGPFLPPRRLPRFGDPGPAQLAINISIAEGFLIKQPIEHAFVFRPDGKPVVYRAGIGGTVTLTEADSALMRGGVVVHNHPSHVASVALSISDWEQIHRWEPATAIVFSRKYTFEVSRKRKFGEAVGEADFDQTTTLFPSKAEQEWYRLQQEIAERVYRENIVIFDESRRHLLPVEERLDAITRFEAFELISHEQSVRFAASRGYDYKRVPRVVPKTGPHVDVNDIDEIIEYTNAIQLDAGQPAILQEIRAQLVAEADVLADAFTNEGADVGRRLEELRRWFQRIDRAVQRDARWEPLEKWMSPRFFRESMEEAIENAKRANALAVLFSKMDKQQWAAQANRYLDEAAEGLDEIRDWLAAEVAEFRAETLPKLRRMGGPLDRDNPILPLETARDLGESIALGEMTEAQALTYARAFEKEILNVVGFVDATAGDRWVETVLADQLNEWFTRGRAQEYIRGMGGRAASVPGSLRIMAKHRIQRQRSLDVLRALDTDGVGAIWDEVAEAAFPQRYAIGTSAADAAQVARVDDLLPLLEPSTRPSAALLASIKKDGIKQPIQITVDLDTGVMVVDDGAHRLAAAVQLDLTTVPIVVKRGELPELVGVSVTPAFTAAVDPDPRLVGEFIDAVAFRNRKTGEIIWEYGAIHVELAKKLPGRAGDWTAGFVSSRGRFFDREGARDFLKERNRRLVEVPKIEDFVGEGILWVEGGPALRPPSKIQDIRGGVPSARQPELYDASQGGVASVLFGISENDYEAWARDLLDALREGRRDAFIPSAITTHLTDAQVAAQIAMREAIQRRLDAGEIDDVVKLLAVEGQPRSAARIYPAGGSYEIDWESVRDRLLAEEYLRATAFGGQPLSRIDENRLFARLAETHEHAPYIWLQNLSGAQRFSVLRRVSTRIEVERAVTRIVDGWSGSSSGTPHAIATQFAIRSHFDVKRPAMSHMGFRGLPDLTEYRRPLTKVYNERLAAVNTSPGDRAARKALREIEAQYGQALSPEVLKRLRRYRELGRRAETAFAADARVVYGRIKHTQTAVAQELIDYVIEKPQYALALMQEEGAFAEFLKTFTVVDDVRYAAAIAEAREQARENINLGEKIYRDSKDLLDAMLDGMYEATQQRIPGEYVVVMRGMKPPPEEAERVASFLGRARSVQWQPANSFSFDPQTATSYARSLDEFRRGFLSIAVVPKERILATPWTGFGAMTEGEVVVLGGPMTTLNLLQPQPSRFRYADWWEFLQRLEALGLVSPDEMESALNYAVSVESIHTAEAAALIREVREFWQQSDDAPWFDPDDLVPDPPTFGQ